MPKAVQVDKTEKLNEQMFFEDVYCNNYSLTIYNSEFQLVKCFLQISTVCS